MEKKGFLEGKFLLMGVGVVVLAALGAVLLLSKGGEGAMTGSATTTLAGVTTTTLAIGVTTTTQGSASIEAEWAQITKPNVEKACVGEAKRYARASGYSDAFIFGCSCSAQEGADRKSYDCSVSAIDGGHPAQAECVKSERTCTISSSAGVNTYTFEQLRSMG